jgi:hypothetical protein
MIEILEERRDAYFQGKRRGRESRPAAGWFPECWRAFFIKRETPTREQNLMTKQENVSLSSDDGNRDGGGGKGNR